MSCKLPECFPTSYEQNLEELYKQVEVNGESTDGRQ